MSSVVLSPGENRVPVDGGWGRPHGASIGSGHRQKTGKICFQTPQMGEVVSVACELFLAAETSHGGMEPVRVPGQLEPVPATRAPSLAWLETEDEKTPTSPHFCLSSGARSSERAPPLPRTHATRAFPEPAAFVPPDESAASADFSAPKGHARPAPRGEIGFARECGATSTVQRILAL